MAKAGILSTASAVLLFLATGPVWGATIQYRMLIDDQDQASFTNFAGTHVLKIQVRSMDSMWTVSGQDIYGGVTTIGYSLLDSTGIPGLITFPASGTLWSATVSSDFTSTKTAGTLDYLGNDVNRGQAISTNAAGGYGPAVSGGMGGHPAVANGTVVDFSDSWYTVAEGNFTFNAPSNESATLSLMSLGNAYNKTFKNTGAVATTGQTAGQILDAVVLTASTEGPEFVAVADSTLIAVANSTLTGMHASGAYSSRETTWTQPPGPGMWWNPNATITLDAPTGLPAGTYDFQWRISDGIHTFMKTVSGDTTVSVGELAWMAPPAPVGAWAYITLTITNTATLGYGVGADALNEGGGTPLFVPEPASLFVLALGAVGALIRRRRR